MEAVRLQGKQLPLWDNALYTLQVLIAHTRATPATATCNLPYFCNRFSPPFRCSETLSTATLTAQCMLGCTSHAKSPFLCCAQYHRAVHRSQTQRAST